MRPVKEVEYKNNIKYITKKLFGIEVRYSEKDNKLHGSFSLFNEGKLS